MAATRTDYEWLRLPLDAAWLMLLFFYHLGRWLVGLAWRLATRVADAAGIPGAIGLGVLIIAAAFLAGLIGMGAVIRLPLFAMGMLLILRGLY